MSLYKTAIRAIIFKLFHMCRHITDLISRLRKWKTFYLLTCFHRNAFQFNCLINKMMYSDKKILNQRILHLDSQIHQNEIKIRNGFKQLICHRVGNCLQMRKVTAEVFSHKFFLLYGGLRQRRVHKLAVKCTDKAVRY